MKAMILCAGRGERMRPLSDTTPKPLLKVHQKPLVVWHIQRLKKLGFKEIVINIAHLGSQIIELLEDGSEFGVKIHYSDERQSGALESAGGIKKALNILGEKFLVVNGDIFCNYTFKYNFKFDKNIQAHLVLVNNPPHNPNGDFVLKNHKIVPNGKRKYTFSGIGYYCAEFFDTVEAKKAPLAPIIHSKIEQNLVSGELFDGIWYDIGTPQRLKEINNKKEIIC